MPFTVDADALVTTLREHATPSVADAIATAVREAPERDLARVNALAFAAAHGLDEEATIAGFLHAARIGLFELAWNVLCPGCGGVLDSETSLKGVNHTEYSCALCAADYEPTLDERVEVAFTVSPRVRRIAAHDPQSLPWLDYYRQIFWGTGQALPEEAELRRLLAEVVIEQLELPAYGQATLPVRLEPGFLILFDPVSHSALFIDVDGAPTTTPQPLEFVLAQDHTPTATAALRPGPARILIENHTTQRTLPGLWRAGDALHDLLGARRPFLTAKRMLSNQVFRDIYRTDTLDVQQRLRITSLTFLFTDLRGSTELYDRVGDLTAWDIVQRHFATLQAIVAAESGAVVKTIGDAVMATFTSPEQAMAAALRMRDTVCDPREELLLKIGLHEGPCLAVMLNERQDYFGQTVNIAARVQRLAASREIFASGPVVGNPATRALLAARGLVPVPHDVALRGVAQRVPLFAIPG
jgi:class 3 adenylate cyclase